MAKKSLKFSFDAYLIKTPKGYRLSFVGVEKSLRLLDLLEWFQRCWNNQHMLSFRVVALAALFSFCLPAPTQAEDVYTLIIKKQEEKKITRWSLAEWLRVKDRMKLMDMWLALHTPSPYEFYLGGEWVRGDVQGVPTQSNYSGSRFYAGAYASIFGLEVQRESTFAERWTGLFNFRFFGYHAQGTNITLQAGIQEQEESGAKFRSALVGVDTTIYLARFFGVRGIFRHHFLSVPNSSGSRISGNRGEGNAFIDFSFLRVYGGYFTESEGAADREGFHLGSTLYF